MGVMMKIKGLILFCVIVTACSKTAAVEPTGDIGTVMTGQGADSMDGKFLMTTKTLISHLLLIRTAIIDH